MTVVCRMDHCQSLPVIAVCIRAELMLDLMRLEIRKASHFQNAVLSHGGIPHQVSPSLHVIDVPQQSSHIYYQTLKYYCNEGLIPNVKRDKNNRRVFDDRDLKWIKDLVCLKKCGMSIQEMKEYLDLCLQGESTICQRKEMLAKKRKALLDSIEELKGCIGYIDWKQDFYDAVLAGEIPYVSNLIWTEQL